jgi:glycosyltransferase involved in cell wall biosynthesis
LLLGVDGEARHHFIENANAGLFFEPENETDLVEKLLYMLRHPEETKEMGKNGRKYANLHFNRDNITTNLIAELNIR